ncbi:MAG: hypothetical protein IKK85_04415 [Clostridia bacterium]|nr:hypothetical protein [Clostridia bacterium]
MSQKEKTLTKEEKEIIKEAENYAVRNLVLKTFSKEELRELEHEINKLLADEKIQRLRFACYNVVKRKIEERMYFHLAETEEKIQQVFKSTAPGDKTVKDKIAVILENDLGLAKREAKASAKTRFGSINQGSAEAERLSREYLINLYSSTKNAEQNANQSLGDVLLQKEFVKFQKELADEKILPSTGWWKFANAVACTLDETVELIAQHLGSTKEEKTALAEEMLGKNISEYFMVNRAISDEVNTRITPLAPDTKDRGIIEEFTEGIDISKDTLKKFNLDLFGERKNPTPEIKVRFYELLKLIALFGMEEKEAREFLAKVNRDFVMTMDLAFLTAITKGYEFVPKEPLYVALITHYLSGYTGKRTDCPRFANPYSFKYIDNVSYETGLIDETLRKQLPLPVQQIMKNKY